MPPVPVRDGLDHSRDRVDPGPPQPRTDPLAHAREILRSGYSGLGRAKHGTYAMTSTDFDSNSAAKRLRDAGFNADQAQAIVEGLHQAAIAGRGAPATKADLAALRIEMRIYGILIVAIAGKLFGIFNAVSGVLDLVLPRFRGRIYPETNLPDHQFYYLIELFEKNELQTPLENHILESVIITKADSFKPLRVMARRCRSISPLPPYAGITQTAKVRPAPPGTRFHFTVDFVNLRDAELDLLLYCLVLEEQVTVTFTPAALARESRSRLADYDRRTRSSVAVEARPSSTS